MTEARPNAPGAQRVREATWLKVTKAPETTSRALALMVDIGEAEAIALASDMEGSLLLADDAKARRVAQHLGVRRMGTLGILRRARKQGLIGPLKPHFQALEAAGSFIKPSLIQAILADLGELDP